VESVVEFVMKGDTRQRSRDAGKAAGCEDEREGWWRRVAAKGGDGGDETHELEIVDLARLGIFLLHWHAILGERYYRVIGHAR
jgi:hypothetical protein